MAEDAELRNLDISTAFYSCSFSTAVAFLQLLISCGQVAEDVELRNLEAMEALEDLDDVDAVFTNMA